MKQRFTLILLSVIAAFSLQAQVVITYATHAPQIGDIVTSVYSNAYTNIDFGNAGANQTWDFSSYTVTENLETGNFVDPANTLWAGEVPNSNIAMRMEIRDETVSYMNQSSSVLKANYIGTYAEEVNMLIEYSDEMELMHYPFAYGDDFTDTYGYTMEYSEMGMLYITNGTITSEADAYGTVSTPNGTFTDVLRIKSTDTETSETWINDVLISTETVTYVTYDWYHGSSKYPVVSIDYDPEYPEDTSITYFSVSTGTNEMESNAVSVCPNPANDMVKINTTDYHVGNKMNILNSNGMVVFSTTIQDNNLIVPVSDFNNGLYFIVIATENGVKRAGKFVVLH